MRVTDYLKRLIIEAPYIRAALENPGGSVILHGIEKVTNDALQVSGNIGSTAHLDVLEVEEALRKMPVSEQRALLSWAMGLSAKEAAEYLSIKPAAFRKRRSRAVHTLLEELREDADA